MMFNIKTPAKINTFLNVDSVREDGYHNISSHMQLVDLFDEISFVPSNSNAIFCGYSELQEQNLIIKSIEYFNETFSTNFNFQITLETPTPSNISAMTLALIGTRADLTLLSCLA